MLHHNNFGDRMFLGAPGSWDVVIWRIYGNTIIVAKSPSAVPGDIDAAYNATRNSLDKITTPRMIAARPIQAFLSASRPCSEFAIVTSITRLRFDSRMIAVGARRVGLDGKRRCEPSHT
jgi:hypothetical protein